MKTILRQRETEIATWALHRLAEETDAETMVELFDELGMDEEEIEFFGFTEDGEEIE